MPIAMCPKFFPKPWTKTPVSVAPKQHFPNTLLSKVRRYIPVARPWISHFSLRIHLFRGPHLEYTLYTWQTEWTDWNHQQSRWAFENISRTAYCIRTVKNGENHDKCSKLHWCAASPFFIWLARRHACWVTLVDYCRITVCICNLVADLWILLIRRLIDSQSTSSTRTMIVAYKSKQIPSSALTRIVWFSWCFIVLCMSTTYPCPCKTLRMDMSTGTEACV